MFRTSDEEPSMPGPLAAYMAEVARHLPLRGTARRAALRDLEEALREASDALGPDEAVRSFGHAGETAARLTDERGGEGGPRLLGVPLGLDPRTLPARLRAVMDPSGPWFVPRVVGAGWDLNVGRVLGALGLVQADELDEDVAAAIPVSRWRLAAVAGVLPFAVTLVVAAEGISRMRLAPLHWPAVGPADEWGSPRAAFGRTMALGAVGAVAVSVSQASRPALATRLGALTAGVVLVDLAAGVTAMTRWAGRRSGAWVLGALAAGTLRAAVLSGALARAGIDRVVPAPGPEASDGR
ncbi:hypothetical protein [Propionicicella superfundia]|uniref:hypothetical protein n=1 Tax=Propionicicella superfundia TaxID=348582 RepID=UPI00040C7412|nr:hypothetical protein [Propionicicella superfundia]